MIIKKKKKNAEARKKNKISIKSLVNTGVHKSSLNINEDFYERMK